jgi:hypothetical protein
MSPELIYIEDDGEPVDLEEPAPEAINTGAVFFDWIEPKEGLPLH